MPHKTITISENAYDLLAGLKNEGESFTEVIERTVRGLREKPLASFAGRWKGTPDELNGIVAQVEDAWKTYDKTLGLGT